MLSHEKIWKTIEILARNHGYSASGLARKAGLDPTTFNKSKRTSPDGKPRWPSTESLARVLEATGESLGGFVALMESGGEAAPPGGMRLPLATLDASGGTGLGPQGLPVGKPRTLDPFSTGGGAPVQVFEVTGRAFEPTYKDGALLIVAPGAPLRRGDGAVVGLKTGEVLTGEVQRRTATRTALQTPSGVLRTFADSEIQWTARILWVRA